MSETLNCPFCAVPTEPTLKNGGNYYLFKCSNCGMFLMYDAVYRKMGKGEFATHKPVLQDFIKRTPAEKIAYIGFKIPTVEGESGLYMEHRPLTES